MGKKLSPETSVIAFEMRNARKMPGQSAKRKSGKSHFPFSKNARASHHLTDRMHGYGLKPLKHNELVSIYALFAWVANEQGAAEETVRLMTETRFNVNDVTGLQQKDYDEVIKFLVDLRIDEMRH